jgi:hypothetical protein
MKHAIYTVKDVKIVAPFTLELTFDDGVTRTIDFGPVLEGELLGPLRNESLFNQVRVDAEARTIMWPNGADFDPATLHDWALYEPEIVARAKGQWAKVAEKRGEYGKTGNQR